MDPATARFYQTNVEPCVRRYDSIELPSLHGLLRRLVQPGDRVLEIGGGSGRDAAFLAGLGCLVTYTDGCPEMLRAASDRHPLLEQNARVASFPLPPNDPLFSASFDLVLCLAVVMHMHDADFRTTVTQIAQLTSPSGCAVVSHSIGRPGLTASRDATGRLFRERSGVEVLDAFAPLGFTLEEQTTDDDVLRRSELCWITQVLRRNH